MEKIRRHYFPADGSVVFTGMCPHGMFGAYREQDDGRVRGYGHTRMAAIADLNEAIGSNEPEEFDHQAARWDHARDLRKHGGC